MEVKGSIETIIFRNDANGYSVIEVDHNGEPVTCVGYFPPISEGQYVKLTGEYKNNARFGLQFSVTSIKDDVPDTVSSTVRYLASGIIKGVGAKTALAIVEKFGMQTMSVIEKEPLRLEEIRGISKKKAQEIGESFASIKKMQDSIMFLQGYDISLNFCMKIYEAYGNNTRQILLSNPYKLVEDVDGIGFVKADKIAIKLGIAKDSDFRVRAGLIHVLKEAADKNGNTCLPENELIEAAEQLLGVSDTTQFQKVLEELIFNQKLKVYESASGKRIMLAYLYHVEKSISALIIRLLEHTNRISIDAEAEISHFEELFGIRFHEAQKEAIGGACGGGFMVITGGPGTGTTTIVKCILSVYSQRNMKALLLAPTGRAAKRLSESTGSDASTIHRALGFEPSSGQFSMNAGNPLDAEVIIVDEVSMVDVLLMNSLLKAVRPGSTVILVGDKDQLPSVGAGNLLSDLIECGKIKVCMLRHIYRQEGESLIVTNAHRINNGQKPELSDNSRDFFFSRKKSADEILSTVVEMVTTRIPKFNGIDPMSIQVLSAMKNGIAGVDNINRTLQRIINPNSASSTFVLSGAADNPVRFFTGDKVMHTVNNYQLAWKRGGEEGEGVYNGDIGRVAFINPAAKEMTVEFDDGRLAVYNEESIYQLTLAYAITIHKSQGCEFDVMIMAVTGGSPYMMTRNLLYTALTRAKKMAVLVGEEYNIMRMVANDYTAKRYSILKDLLDSSQKEYDKLYNLAQKA